MNAHFKELLFEMEKLAGFFNIEPFDMYLLGGSALILMGYSDRATRDFDFIDQIYPASYGKLFTHLKAYDMLEYESAFLAPDYQERAIRLTDFQYLRIYTLSVEDIIVSKLVRLAEKDYEDIDALMLLADKVRLLDLIEAALARTDLYEAKKEAVMAKLGVFKERYNV
jgi:hypothetical protein